MARSGNDLQRLGCSQPGQGLLVQFDDAEIGAADDQKSGCPHLVERIAGEVRAPAARHRCADTARKFSRRNQCRRGSGAGAEQPKWKLGNRRLAIDPMDSVGKPVRQQRDVEHVGAVGFLRRSQQIEQHRRDAPIVQRAGDDRVARAQTA